MEYDNKAGRKYDVDKARYELIPPEFMEALAMLYAKGAEKYEPRNWELGMSWSRLFGAMMRHAWAWFRGERDDPETEIHHMVAVAWNAIALYTHEIRGIGDSDRPSCKGAEAGEEKEEQPSEGAGRGKVPAKSYWWEAKEIGGGR